MPEMDKFKCGIIIKEKFYLGFCHGLIEFDAETCQAIKVIHTHDYINAIISLDNESLMLA